MNLGFSLIGIYFAHTFQKSKRKLWQCICTWLLVYLFWITAGAFLDACFLNHSAFPNMTHERIGMFIAPLAIFAYRFLYPEARLPACIFYYYMADNVLILQILFSRTLAMLLVQLFGLPDQETILCVYVLSLAVVVVLYRTWARGKMRCVLRDFQDRMGLLAAFAFAPLWRNAEPGLCQLLWFAALGGCLGTLAAADRCKCSTELCGDHNSCVRLRCFFSGRGGACAGRRDAKKSIHGSADWFEKPARHAE